MKTVHQGAGDPRSPGKTGKASNHETGCRKRGRYSVEPIDRSQSIRMDEGNTGSSDDEKPEQKEPGPRAWGHKGDERNDPGEEKSNAYGP